MTVWLPNTQLGDPADIERQAKIDDCRLKIDVEVVRRTNRREFELGSRLGLERLGQGEIEGRISFEWLGKRQRQGGITLEGLRQSKSDTSLEIIEASHVDCIR